MTDKINLVRNDTRPALVVTLTDETTELPINIAGATVVLKFRASGATALQATVSGAVTDGANGVVVFHWPEDALSGEPGSYEAEIEIRFADGTVQTVYDVLKFRLRQDF